MGLPWDSVRDIFGEASTFRGRITDKSVVSTYVAPDPEYDPGKDDVHRISIGDQQFDVPDAAYYALKVGDDITIKGSPYFGYVRAILRHSKV